MTKNQLVSKLADDSGISKKQADEVLNSLVTTVIKSVKKGEPLKIPGLGIFRLRKMKARMGRNPQTGEAIKIPARKKVGFTVAKSCLVLPMRSVTAFVFRLTPVTPTTVGEGVLLACSSPQLQT